MSWRTTRRNLTKDQIERGVIYSSELIVKNRPDIERVRHEVFADDEDASRKIQNLKDVSFFKSMARDCGWNVVNEVRE